MKEFNIFQMIYYALPRVFNSTAPSYADPSARGYGCQIYRIHTPTPETQTARRGRENIHVFNKKTSSFWKVPVIR